jgi:hypothetical protein
MTAKAVADTTMKVAAVTTITTTMRVAAAVDTVTTS